MRSWTPIALVVVGCSSNKTPDPCDVTMTTATGTIEVGLTSPNDVTAYAPITDGEVAQIHTAPQYEAVMFVINARTSGLDIVAAPGGTTATITEAGKTVSQNATCQQETFIKGTAGDQMFEPLNLLFDKALEPSPFNKTFTLTATLQDIHGAWATVSYQVVGSPSSIYP